MRLPPPPPAVKPIPYVYIVCPKDPETVLPADYAVKIKRAIEKALASGDSGQILVATQAFDVHTIERGAKVQVLCESAANDSSTDP